MHSTWPSPLKKGDFVDIIAPSFGCPVEVLDKIASFLRSWGLIPIIPKDILGSDLLCAQTDKIRFDQLSKAIHNSQSRHIWCLRGGYGASRILPLLKGINPPAAPKLLIGFSDTTCLHIFLNQEWGWPSLHAPPLRSIVTEEVSGESIAFVKDSLFGTAQGKELNIIPLNQAALDSGPIIAPIVGGNLTLIESGLGTFWQAKGGDKIILLEEADEEGYRIDRSLTHLFQAGLFQGAKAVLLGDFIGKQEKDGICLVEPVLERFAKSLSIPVFKIPGIGHGSVNWSLPLGTPVTLEKTRLLYKI